MPQRPIGDRGGAPIDSEPDPGLPGQGVPGRPPQPAPGRGPGQPGGDRGGAPIDSEPDPGLPGTPPQEEDEADTPPLVDEPGITIQLPRCLDPLGLKDDVEGQLREQYPDADRRFFCVEGREHIGIWLHPVERDEHLDTRNERRDETLAAIDLLGGRDRVAFRISADYLQERADEIFAGFPKRMDTSGQEDENGPVRLRYVEVDLAPPDMVETTVGVAFKGRKYRIRVEDRLSVGHGPAQPIRASTEVKIRPKPFKWLVAVYNAFRVLYADSRRNPKGKAGREAATGRQLAEELPPQFLIRGTQSKLALDYDELTMTETHLDALAKYEIVEREPAVALTGPSEVQVIAAQASITAIPRDLRKPRLQWSLDGERIHPTPEETEDDTEVKVSVQLPRRSNHTYVLTVIATDEDGGRAEGRHLISMVAVPDAGRGPGKGAGDGTERPGRPPLTP